MLDRMDTAIERTLRHASVDPDFQGVLLGDTLHVQRDNGLNTNAIDFLLETMEWEIFADFRKRLDFPFAENSLAILFRVTF
ncbi:MAG: hypothetical protein HXS52_08140 [Theionarchaea archaeon]|nr:hypothetical protein [Theionarchaea archaeon]MBU7037886.1 hypothetical protein [Theionarchaea archaeon]